MPRKSNNFTEKDKKRAEFVVETWRAEEYPEKYSGESYTDDEYPRHGKSSTNKHRKQYVETDFDDERRQNIQDYYSRGDEVIRKDYRRENPQIEDDNPIDYETYTYEHKTQSYIKSPRNSGDVKMRDRQRQKQRMESSHERYLPEYEMKTKYDREYQTNENYKHKYEKTSRPKTDSYPSDEAIQDHAATKIQAAYKGFSTRKDFWKKMEHHRRQKSLEDVKQYRKDEYIVSSATVVDDAITPLAANADPNLGLTASLPYIDSSQRNAVIRDLKKTTAYSDEIKTVPQLQTETSPNIIVLGGINPPESEDYLLGASIFVYSVQKDKWFFGGTMPEPRNYHTAAYLNGKIYVIGGYSPFLINEHEMVATQTTFQLTVRSRRWRKRGEMHQARACHGMCIVNDNIMVMGGRDSAGKLLSTVELYYPKRDQWVLLKSMPEALMGLSCSVLDGSIYVIGGIVSEGHSSQFTVSNHVYAFDFEKQMWYRAPPLPEPRAFGCASTLKREIWLWCGVRESFNEDGYLVSTNSVLVYNPDVLKWEQHAAIGTLKHAATIAKCGRRIYLLGGMSNTSNFKEILNENDIYNRETDNYREGAPLPSPLAGTAAVALPIDYIATSDPKWNSENINEEVMKEAATKIQAVFRGYKTRSSISNHKFPIYDSDAVKKNNRTNAFVYNVSVDEPHMEKWSVFQRVEIDDWPPIPNPQVSNSDVNLRFGTLPKGYTVTSANSRTKVRRYVPLPPHADPNLSMTGHLCNVYKRAKKILGLRKVERLPSFANNLITASTLQDDSLPVILIMGGLQPRDPVNLSYGKLILRYHILKNRWEYFGALPEPRNYHAAVYYQEHIYVTGGCDPDFRNSGEMVSTNNTFCLNIHSSEWVEKAEMHCNRSHHSLVVALGKIFAIGGRDNNGRLVASIEAYDIENDKWSILRPMTNPRMGMACAVVDDHIWCLGGIGLSDDSKNLTYPVLSSVISYDIGKDVWISRPPLRCPRAFASCVVVEDALWLCGGASKDRTNSTFISMASIDKYYHEEAQWIRKTLINNPRHCAAVVAVDSCIYIFGGVSSQEWSPLSRNEMIVVNDISLHTCKELPVPLTGLAAVAVPPVVPSLRSESLANLLHTQLTYH